MELTELYEMAEELHIGVFERSLPVNRSFSLKIPDMACYIALDTNKLHTEAEKMVTLAHEIGHCTTGSFYNRHSPFDVRERHENRANKKAVLTLIPLNKLVDAVEGGAESIFELSEHFSVTEDFMRYALEMYEQDLMDTYSERHGDE